MKAEVFTLCLAVALSCVHGTHCPGHDDVMLSGTALGADGSPLANCLVELASGLDFEDASQGGVAAEEVATRLATRTGPAGTFLFPRVIPGGYRLKISHTDYPAFITNRIVLAGTEKALDVGKLALRPGSRVGGSISRRGAGGTFRVVLSNVACTHCVTTDPSGHFTFPQMLPYGLYEVTAEQVTVEQPMQRIVDRSRSLRLLEIDQPVRDLHIDLPAFHR